MGSSKALVSGWQINWWMRCRCPCVWWWQDHRGDHRNVTGSAQDIDFAQPSVNQWIQEVISKTTLTARDVGSYTATLGI